MTPLSKDITDIDAEQGFALQQWIDDSKFQLALIYANTFCDNDTGMVFSDCAIGMVRKNEITNNLIGVFIADNALPIMGIAMSGQNLFITVNDSLDTLQNYSIYNNTPNYILAQGNWWGTNSEDTIAKIIYDYYDDNNLGKVDFKPFRKYNSKGAEGTMESNVGSGKDLKFRISIPTIIKGNSFDISCTIPTKSEISIRIYDITGRLCKKESFDISKGKRNLTIETNLAQGVYFIKFRVLEYSVTKKVVLLAR